MDRYAEVARALDFCPVGVSDEDAAESLPVELDRLNAELKVPSLEEFGIVVNSDAVVRTVHHRYMHPKEVLITALLALPASVDPRVKAPGVAR